MRAFSNVILGYFTYVVCICSLIVVVSIVVALVICFNCCNVWGTDQEKEELELKDEKTEMEMKEQKEP